METGKLIGKDEVSFLLLLMKKALKQDMNTGGKKMKRKLLSYLLCLTMVISSGTPAAAADMFSDGGGAVEAPVVQDVGGFGEFAEFGADEDLFFSGEQAEETVIADDAEDQEPEDFLSGEASAEPEEAGDSEDISQELPETSRTEHYYVAIPSAGSTSYKYIKPSDYFDGDYTYEMITVNGKNEFLRITNEICVTVDSSFTKQECIITAKDAEGNAVESIVLEINGFLLKASVTNSDDFYPDGENKFVYVYDADDTELMTAHIATEAYLDGEKLEELPDGMELLWNIDNTSNAVSDGQGNITLNKVYGSTYVRPYIAFKEGQQYYEGAYSQIIFRVYPRHLEFTQKVFTVAMPEDGYISGPVQFNWQDNYYYGNECTLKCLDPEVADVTYASSRINITPKKTGTARVLVQWNMDSSNYTIFQVQVLGVSVAAADGSGNKYIYIDPADETVVPQLQLKATGTKRSETFTWSSSDETVATVDESGLVTGLKEGPVTIYATSSLSTDETVVKGAVRLQVMENKKPYLSNMSFYSYKMFEGWTGSDSEFHAAKHDYDIQIKNSNNTLSVFRVTPYFDEEKFGAVLSTQTYGGEYSETVLENGMEVSKSNALEPGWNAIYIDVTDKEDDLNTTRYTFNVFRPYTTTNTITRMTVLPNGQTALAYPKYKNYAEGNIFKYTPDTDTLGSSGFSSSTYDYKIYVFGERTNSIVFTPYFGNSYEHVYLTKDDGEAQIQTHNWPCAEQQLNEEGVTRFVFGVMSDKAYAEAKQQAEDAGTEFVFAPEKTYTFYVEKVSPLGIDAKILSAELTGAEFYKPGFSPETYSLSALMDSGVSECTMKFTVPDGIEVFKGSMTDANRLEGTPAEGTDEDVLTYEITVPAGSVSTNVTINLRKWNEEGTESGASAYTYSFKTRGPKDAVPDSVEGYLCIGSQYTNMGSYGLTPERTLVNGGGVLSLGGFGGYITWKYDNPIVNSKNNPYGVDFIVYGNPFAASQGAAEPGNVMVSQDGENWYYLAGSMHYDDEADWNYSVTYTNDGGQSSWTDNRGNSGTNYKFPESSLYPYYNWAEGQQSVTVSGLKLVNDTKDPYGSASAAYPDFGYVDVNVNGSNKGVASNPYTGSHLTGGDAFDIDWAVDANGMPVHLDSISYIRVSTASHIYAGAIGEKSTEVTYAYRVLNPSESAVGTTEAPVSITVDGTEVSMDSQVTTAIYSGEGLEVKVDAPEDTNVYINGAYGKERTYETVPEKRILRIITQEGEKEPDIRYIRLIRSDEVRGLTLNVSLLSLEENETAVLTASVTPADAANTNVIWTSSDENVAKVSSDGTVTGVKEGTAVITCTSEENADIFAECTVTVTAVPVAESITLDKTSLSLDFGKTAKLKATVKPDNAKDKTVVWSSSDEKVAKVASDGTVTAAGTGIATITCASAVNENVKAACKVTVKDNTFMRLKTTAYTTSVKLSWTKIASADGYEIYGSRCGTDVKKLKTIKNTDTTSWTQEKLKKATSYKYSVKAYKLVNGKKEYVKETYRAHVTTKGGKYTNAKRVTVSAEQVSLKAGSSKKITAKVTKVDSSKKIVKHADTISWKSSNTKVAKVSSDGKITAVKAGTCTVYVYAGNGVYTKIKVTVK